MQRISYHASAGTPTVGIFVGPQGITDPAYRRDSSPALQDNIADEIQPIYVGPGEYLVVQYLGATAAATCSTAYQIKISRIGRRPA